MTLGFPGPLDAAAAQVATRRRISPVTGAGRHDRRRSIPSSPRPGCACSPTGGNAVDAAVAAALVGTVVMPGRCGIGGDLFAIVASPDPCRARRRLAFHGSGIAPRGASLEFMREHGEDAAGRPPRDGPARPALAVRPRVRRRVLLPAGALRHTTVRGAGRHRPSATPRMGSRFRPAKRIGIVATADVLGRLPDERRRLPARAGRRRGRATSCANPIWPARSRSSPRTARTPSTAARSPRRSRRSWRRTAAR